MTRPVRQFKANQTTDAIKRSVLTVLRENADRYISKDLIEEALGGFSRRTIDRAFAALEEDGAKLDVKQKGTSRLFRLTKSPEWDESVSAEGMVALHLSLLSLEQAGTELWSGHLSAFVDKAAAHLSSKDRQIFLALKDRIAVQGASSDPVITDPDVLRQVILSLSNPAGPEEITLTYESSLRKSSTRACIPFAINHDVFSGGAYLLAWDRQRNKPVHFRLNRIESVVRSGRPGVFPKPKAMELARNFQIGGWFDESVEPFQVSVRIRNKGWAKALVEAPPALPEVEVDPNPDGTATVCFQATELSSPSRWVLQFGASAEVLGPEALRETIRQELAQAADQYRAS